MRLIRSLSTLVLLGSVSWMLGCTADEDTSGLGAGGAPVGSGVAGGAVVPHSHEGEDVHAHDGDTPKIEAPADVPPTDDAPVTEAPKTEVPADDAPVTEEPKTEAPAADAPVTEEPKTEVPADDAPKTEEPTTDAPTDDAPKSE